MTALTPRPSPFEGRLRRPPQGAAPPPRRLDQPFGGGAGLGGDLGAGEHAGDLLAALVGRHFRDARGDAFALLQRVLADDVMTVGAGGHPPGVGHPPHPHPPRRPPPPRAAPARRTPIASATAPPTPVSISSNPKVGAEPRSASTTFRASRKRDSSPPEATFIKGPGRVPGLVCTQNSTRSMPFGPAAAAALVIAVENVARSSLSGLSSPFTALSSAGPAFTRALDSASAALRKS